MASIDDALRTTIELTTKKLDDLSKQISKVNSTVKSLGEAFEKLPAVKTMDVEFRVRGEGAVKEKIAELTKPRTAEIEVVANTTKTEQKIKALKAALGETAASNFDLSLNTSALDRARTKVKELRDEFLTVVKESKELQTALEEGTVSGSKGARRLKALQQDHDVALSNLELARQAQAIEEQKLQTQKQQLEVQERQQAAAQRVATLRERDIQEARASGGAGFRVHPGQNQAAEFEHGLLQDLSRAFVANLEKNLAAGFDPATGARTNRLGTQPSGFQFGSRFLNSDVPSNLTTVAFDEKVTAQRAAQVEAAIQNEVDEIASRALVSAEKDALQRIGDRQRTDTAARQDRIGAAQASRADARARREAGQDRFRSFLAQQAQEVEFDRQRAVEASRVEQALRPPRVDSFAAGPYDIHQGGKGVGQTTPFAGNIGHLLEGTYKDFNKEVLASAEQEIDEAINIQNILSRSGRRTVDELKKLGEFARKRLDSEQQKLTELEGRFNAITGTSGKEAAERQAILTSIAAVKSSINNFNNQISDNEKAIAEQIRRETAAGTPEQRAIKANKQLLFLEPGEDFEEKRVQLAAKNNIPVNLLRSQQPGFFEPERLKNPETLIQLGFAGAFGGLPSLLGGVIGGATPLGAGGALLGSTLTQAAGDILFRKPIELIASQIDQFKEAGLAFERSILGISSILQTQGQLAGPGGQPLPILEQLQARTAQATNIQLAARAQLLPLGVGGASESTIVQGIVSALASRGFQGSPEQIATIARNIVGAIQAQRPSLLDNTQQLLKDLQDVLGGGPNAQRTILYQLIRPATAGITGAKGIEDVVTASNALSDFATTATKLQTPITVLQKLSGAIENIRTAAGTAFLDTVAPAFQRLFEVLGKPEVQESVVRITEAFARLTEVGITALANALDFFSPIIAAVTDAALKALPALTALASAIATLATQKLATAALEFGGSKLGPIFFGKGGGKAAGAAAGVAEEVASDAATAAIAATTGKAAVKEAAAVAEKEAVALAEKGGVSFLEKAIAQKATQGLLAGIGTKLAGAGASLAIPGIGEVLSAVAVGSAVIDAYKLVSEASASQDEEKAQRQEAQLKAAQAAFNATDLTKPDVRVDAALSRAGLKEAIDKSVAEVNPLTQERELRNAAKEQEGIPQTELTEADLQKRLAIIDQITKLETDRFERELPLAYDLSTAEGQLEAQQLRVLELNPRLLAQEQSKLDAINLLIEAQSSQEAIDKRTAAAKKEVAEASVAEADAEEKLRNARDLHGEGSIEARSAAFGVQVAKRDKAQADENLRKARSPEQNTKNDKLIEERTLQEQKVLAVQQAGSKEVQKWYDDMKKVSALFDDMVKTTQQITQFEAQTDLRRASNLSARYQAGKTFLASGGDRAEITDAQVGYLLDNPDEAKRVLAEEARQKYRADQERLSPGQALADEEDQRNALLDKSIAQADQAFPFPVAAPLPSQSKVALTPEQFQAFQRGELDANGKPTGKLSGAAQAEGVSGIIDGVAISGGKRRALTESDQLSGGKSGVPVFENYTGFNEFDFSQNANPNPTGFLFPEERAIKNAPENLLPGESPLQVDENGFQLLPVNSEESVSSEVSPIFAPAQVASYKKLSADKQQQVADINTQIQELQGRQSQLNAKANGSTFDFLGLKLPTFENLAGLDKPRDPDEKEADDLEDFNINKQIYSLIQQRKQILKAPETSDLIKGASYDIPKPAAAKAEAKSDTTPGATTPAVDKDQQIIQLLSRIASAIEKNNTGAMVEGFRQVLQSEFS